MKHCAVAPAIEEPAPDPGAPACRVCHVSLREFVAPPKLFQPLDLVMPSCSGTCATSEAVKDHQLILKMKKRGCGHQKANH